MEWKEREQQYGISNPHEVVRTVEVEKGQETYRIEVLKSCLASPMCYEGRCWRKEEINGGEVWVGVAIPSVRALDPDVVLNQALGHLPVGTDE